MSMHVDPIEVLKKAKVIAVLGASRNPWKDAHRVPKYLKESNYKIIPINPNAQEILGEKAYPSLKDVPLEVDKNIDVVEVFRPPEEAVEVIRQVKELQDRIGKEVVVWFQIGTVSEEALREAEKLGLKVVANKCMMVEHKRMKR